MDKPRVVFFSAIGLIVAAFLGASMLALRTVNRIQDVAAAITDDYAPSIEYLARARDDMRELELAVEQAITGTLLPEELQGIQRSQARLQEDLAGYVALPAGPDEQAYVRQLIVVMGELQKQAGAAVANAQAGRVEEANRILRSELRQTVDRARAMIQADVALNAREASNKAARVESLRASQRP